MANWDVDKVCPLILRLIVWSQTSDNAQLRWNMCSRSSSKPPCAFPSEPVDHTTYLTLKLELMPQESASCLNWWFDVTPTTFPRATSVIRGCVPCSTSGPKLNSAAAPQRSQQGPGNENHRSLRLLQCRVLLWALTQRQVVKTSTCMWPFPIPSDTDPQHADEGSEEALKRTSSASPLRSRTVPWRWSSHTQILI